MRTSRKPWAALTVAAALATTLAACAADGPDGAADGASPTPTASPVATTTTVPATRTADPSPDRSIAQAVTAEITVEDGQVVGGAPHLEVPLDAAIELTVDSDVADSVHVHGYDIETAVAPDEPASIHFTADIPGVFEVELEERGLKLAELQVGG